MKQTLRITTLIAIAIMQANSVFAASGAKSGSISLGGWIFIGFIAVIVASQFIPALFMFGSMMAALLRKTGDHTEAIKNGKAHS